MLAAVQGRTDWWNVYEEHTAYEWAYQVAQYQVEPWGELREDLRHAHVTAFLVACQAAKQLTDDDISTIKKSLTTYLQIHEDRNNDLKADPDVLRALQRMKAD